MIKASRWLATGAVLLMAGCASTPVPVKQDVHITLANPDNKNLDEPEIKRVLEGVQMVHAGHIQAAIDGPFNEVVNHYESQYANSKQKIFSARGMEDTLMYSVMMAAAKPPISSTVLGPAWAMAYWGRGYAYNEMARYDAAIAELQKALALAPSDTQYNIEIGYSYEQKGQWQTSFDHFKTAEAFASMTVPPEDLKSLTCKALRGQGYNLTEMHQYDDARAAYRACLKLIPNEPGSLNELKYIDQAQAKNSRR